MKYGFAYKNGKLVNIFCGREELFNELKSFLVKTFSLKVSEVSRHQYIAEQKNNNWKDTYSL
ncbi:hypothetical protein [Bacillus atrophaeus]|uniref:hypothetical protein n=1 Tax=Bacillus atrophaeus TaxID=1452 RepID=UPI000B92695F|nr:hypothetical protein [Bacillus atrophaeus]ASS70098.1 hypothetical protein BaGK_03525 [Bacillus atrophaeus]MCY8947988.1 hypothetical protein [Bacillus atrophaeus]MCY8968850.1 hypothetical protein [Bacillus atrophaeus]MCY8973590.1 hypothetical protein [Bacillus atrophaeus]MCY9166033.1 hypothetical protein [Bacillus atrophaeus]